MAELSRRVSPTVVVFEADPDTRNLYTQYLESRGANVRSAATAADTFGSLHDGSPLDALIFDVVQLGMPVPAFCQAARQIAGAPPPRLILVTGWLMSPDDYAALTRLGVALHLKPISLDACGPR